MRALSTNSGQKNVAIGRDAMRFNTLGSFNTSIGQESGNLNQGSLNVFLGYRSGFNETGDSKLYIDNSDTATPLIYGDFANDALVVNGTLNITETAKLTPLASAPGCGTADAGLMYFDDTLKKLRVCDGTAWQNLH
jgi:hypothetical protein